MIFLVARWKKKPRDKRRSFLLEKTDLFERKWAPVHLIQDKPIQIPSTSNALVDFAILKSVESFIHMYRKDKTARENYRTSWLLPYLDAETLSEDPLRFLTLLHTRIANEPEAWVMFDNTQLVLAEQMFVLTPEYNPNCVIMQSPDFGKLVKWSAERAHCWAAVGYNKAQNVLTAQRTMMEFLRKVVHGLLQDSNAPTSAISQPKWQKLVENRFANFGNGHSLLWSEHVNQPFSSPPKFDPYKLVDMVDARYHASVDEIWLAQTDPAYVQLLVRNLTSTVFFEHTDAQGKWGYAIDELLFNQLRREWYWRQMHKECHLLLQCFEKMQRDVNSVKAREK